MDNETIHLKQMLQGSQYIAECKLSQGSYGQIYRVTRTKSNKIFVLKALELASLIKQRKVHEAIIESIVLSKLSHPGIIKITEAIYRSDYIGLILEYCPYGDIFSLMKRVNHSVSLAKKKRNIMVYYLSQILNALDYLHSLGVVHRDLKPENIVIGPDLKIRIIDFGTARIKPELITKEETKKIEDSRNQYEQGEITSSDHRKSLVGSACYLSPEALKLQYSEKSDIWAFGVIIYKFYHNCLPFQGQDNYEVFSKIKTSEVVMDPSTPPEIQELILLCLKKDPLQRPTLKMLRKCSLFLHTDVEHIFSVQPPILKEEIASQEESGKNLFELQLEKKMFFGNYKPRILTIAKTGSRLFMAYKYVDTKLTKNEFEISLNDYAEDSGEQEFTVVTEDKKYQFRVLKGVKCLDVVEKINQVIRDNFNLA